MDGRAMILRAVPGLEDQPPAVLLALAGRLTERFVREAWLCREGDPSAALYVLAEGHLGVFRQGAQVAVLGPGAIVGHVGVLSEQPRSAGLRVLGAVTLLELEAGAARALVAEEAAAGAALRRALIVACGRQLREATRALVRLSAQASPAPDAVEAALLAAKGAP